LAKLWGKDDHIKSIVRRTETVVTASRYD